MLKAIFPRTGYLAHIPIHIQLHIHLNRQCPSNFRFPIVEEIWLRDELLKVHKNVTCANSKLGLKNNKLHVTTHIT